MIAQENLRVCFLLIKDRCFAIMTVEESGGMYPVFVDRSKLRNIV
jgi:hypothetical protein